MSRYRIVAVFANGDERGIGYLLARTIGIAYRQANNKFDEQYRRENKCSGITVRFDADLTGM